MSVPCARTVTCTSTRRSAGLAISGCWCASKSVCPVGPSFSPRTRSAASWARNGTGTGTTEAPAGRIFGFNNDNWFENYGPLPTDQRHLLNLSGFVELPWRLQLGINVSAYSATPFAPFIANADFNGDGTINDLLPGTTVNQFGRGSGKDDLTRLVNVYNRAICRQARRVVSRGAGYQRCRTATPSTTRSSRRICVLTRTFNPRLRSRAGCRLHRGLQPAQHAEPGWSRARISACARVVRSAWPALQSGLRVPVGLA